MCCVELLKNVYCLKVDIFSRPAAPIYSAASTLAYSGDTTAGVLTVTSGANVAHLHLNGALTLASFAKASDGAGGLLISHT